MQSFIYFGISRKAPGQGLMYKDGGNTEVVVYSDADSKTEGPCLGIVFLLEET